MVLIRGHQVSETVCIINRKNERIGVHRLPCGGGCRGRKGKALRTEMRTIAAACRRRWWWDERHDRLSWLQGVDAVRCDAKLDVLCRDRAGRGDLCCFAQQGRVHQRIERTPGKECFVVDTEAVDGWNEG